MANTGGGGVGGAGIMVIANDEFPNAVRFGECNRCLEEHFIRVRGNGACLHCHTYDAYVDMLGGFEAYRAAL